MTNYTKIVFITITLLILTFSCTENSSQLSNEELLSKIKELEVENEKKSKTISELNSRINPSTIPTSISTAISTLPSHFASSIPTSSTSPISPSITPTPTAIQSTSTFILEDFDGKVYDDTGTLVKGASVTVKSLDKTTPFEVTTVALDGSYAINRAPTGIFLQITAMKDGFSSRNIIEILETDYKNQPNANRFDFGTADVNQASTSISALSEKPEVIRVSPDFDSTGIKSTSDIVLTFSEPMAKDTVEENFAIRSFNNQKLTVDSGSSSNTFTGSNDLNITTGSLIWDINDFKIAWSENDSVLTLTFKDFKKLPGDKNLDAITYAVSFSASQNSGASIKDAQGVSRTSNYFKLNELSSKNSFKFSIIPDKEDPEITSINANAAETTSNRGDMIKVTFSKPMIFHTRTISVGGGLEDRSSVLNSELKAPAGHPNASTNATRRNASKNYIINVIDQNSQALWNMSWFSVGGTATYDTEDITNRNILLLPPKNTSGINLNNVGRNGIAALSTSTTSTIVGGANDNSTFNFGWKLLKPDGQSSIQMNSGDLESANIPSDANHLATLLQTQLNLAANTTGLTPPTSSSPWIVTAMPDNKSLSFKFNDTLGNYIAWQKIGGTFAIDPEDQLPDGQFLSGFQSWTKELDLFKLNDQIQVTVSSTVMDPAGNTIKSQNGDFVNVN